MGIASEGSAAPFATKVTPQELGQIITLRKNLDLMEGLGKFAAQYLKLGWSLLALDARTGANLGVDFTLPPRDWSRCLMDESLKGAEVNLAVRTGSPSRLFVITVDSEAGGRQLDAFGPWRSPCIARNKTTREQHFYHLPSFWELSTASVSALKVLGEGAMALVPPSMEPDLEDTWHWWQAPWESPPCPPPPGLTHFLEKTGLLSTPELEGRPPLTWHEVLPRISGHKELLRALLVPQASLSRYYQQIITEALKAGVNDPKLLKTLLWHAPHGDAPQRPERWRGLLKVVTEVDRGRRGLSQAAASTPKEAENLPPSDSFASFGKTCCPHPGTGTAVGFFTAPRPAGGLSSGNRPGTPGDDRPRRNPPLGRMADPYPTPVLGGRGGHKISACGGKLPEG
jgi:hypothetical protein